MLKPDTQAYFATASAQLWTHPTHVADNETFEVELKCWFALMCSTSCGGLGSRAEQRQKELTRMCLTPSVDWRPIMGVLSQEEKQWLKKSYPSVQIGEDGSTLHY